MNPKSKSCAVCKKTKKLKTCSSCEQVFYCSPEHQKQHWKAHKEFCKPYQISSNEALGRFLEATRDIRAGAVIFTENPFVIGPDWSYDLFATNGTFNCVGCFEPIKMLNHRCPTCKWPCCKPDCVGISNPKLHEIECSLLKEGVEMPSDSDYDALRNYFRTDILLAIKCLILQKRHPKKFEQLYLLDSHLEEREKIKNQNYEESKMRANFIGKNFVNQTNGSESDRKVLEKINAIIERNAVYVTENNQVTGVYAVASNVEHSCMPNCHFLYDKRNGFKLTVRAARDIVKGEHITTCYSNILWGTQMRQSQLRNIKYFSCQCPRCQDPTELDTDFSSLKCIGIEGITCDGFQIPINPLDESLLEWECIKCPARVNGTEVTDLMKRMNDEIDHTIETEATVPAIQSLMEKLSTFLHPNHYHMFTLKHTLIQLYGNHRDYAIETMDECFLRRKLNYCDDLMKIVKKLDPWNIRLSIYMAVILHEKFKAIAEMHRRQLNNVAYTAVDGINCLERAMIVLANEQDTMQGRILMKNFSKTFEEIKSGFSIKY